MNVKKYTRESPGFYELMGPMFGSRELEKEVGIHLYDDADKVWYIAFKSGRLLGFASLRGRVVSDCYVLPARRGQGVFAAVLETLIDDTAEDYLRAACTAASAKRFHAAGFRATRKTKNFTFMELHRA